MRIATRLRQLLVAASCLSIGAASAQDRTPEQLVEARCQNCHGMTGQSSSPDYPKLAGQNAEYLQRQLLNFKLGRRASGVMKGQVDDLSGQELAALAEYFSSKPLEPDIAFDPALAEVGRYLYFNGNTYSGVSPCSTCHGPNAYGALFLPRLAGQHANYIERQLKFFIEHARQTQEMTMHSVVTALTALEIHALAQYLSGLR